MSGSNHKYALGEYSNVMFSGFVLMDHFLLNSTLRLYPPSNHDSSANSVGKDIWRTNPRLAQNIAFQDALDAALSKCVNTMDTHLAPSDQWEHLKLIAKKTAQSFSRRIKSFLVRAEDLLQKKRSGIKKKLIKDPAKLPLLSLQLTIVEQQLTSLQQYHVEILVLRSGIRWRE